MKSIAALLVSTAFAFAANATPISGGSFTNLETKTEISQVNNLSYFDSTLGTLNSAFLTLSGSAHLQFILTNNSPNPQTVKASSDLELSFGSSVSTLNTLLAAGSPYLFMSGTSGFQTIAAGATYTSPVFAGSDSKTIDISALVADLSKAGGGNFTLTCTSFTNTSTSGGGGNVNFGQDTTAGCGASLAYDYTARTQVPEPGALALVGIALAGLGLARRRKA